MKLTLSTPLDCAIQPPSQVTHNGKKMDRAKERLPRSTVPFVQRVFNLRHRRIAA